MMLLYFSLGFVISLIYDEGFNTELRTIKVRSILLALIWPLRLTFDVLKIVSELFAK